MITLQISLHSNNRGRGKWKLNTSFLNDIEYVIRIKLIINQTKAEYVQDDTVNPNLLWEMVKMKVREESLKYGTSKKKKLTKKEEEIEQAIASLEKCLSEFKGDETRRQKVWSELETKKRELEAIIEYRTKGAILRSKSQWYNEGEKNTKYFLNLEKRHCKQGTISQLKVNDSDLIYTDKEILSPGQTIATCQRNMSQHCWAQHAACVWPPCCDVLRHVGCCWLKFDHFQN